HGCGREWHALHGDGGDERPPRRESRHPDRCQRVRVAASAYHRHQPPLRPAPGGLLGVIPLSPNEDELRAEAEMMARIANLSTVGGGSLQWPVQREQERDHPAPPERAESDFERRWPTRGQRD